VPAKQHLEPITLWHLILSSTIDVISAFIIVPVTINGSKGTIITIGIALVAMLNSAQVQG